MRRSRIAALVGAILVGWSLPASANLIVNGSFEDPALAANDTSRTLPGGDTSITGWTVLGVDILLLRTNYGEPGSGVDPFNAQDGNNSVDLTGAGNTGPTDGIQQVVTTNPGTTYLLSFYVGRAQSNNGASFYQTPATVDLSIDGGPRVGYTNSDATPGRINWKLFTTSFVATGASTTIAFLNGTPSQTSEAGLDNVNLVAVPEPTTFALASVGLLASLGMRRRLAG